MYCPHIVRVIVRVIRYIHHHFKVQLYMNIGALVQIKDEVTRTMMMASCMAYREWADKRETGVYVK
jgi:hypothetical protein